MDNFCIFLILNYLWKDNCLKNILSDYPVMGFVCLIVHITVMHHILAILN